MPTKKSIGAAAVLATCFSLSGIGACLAAEEKPLEHMQVCDAYGVGFINIPETSTCLRISGYVWSQTGATNDDGYGVHDPVTNSFDGSAGNFNGFAPGHLNSSSRVRINLDVYSETELGSLRAVSRVEADTGSGNDGYAVLDQAYIQIEGFRTGYIESAWVETVKEVSSYGSHSWNGMWTGYQKRNLIQYNFGEGSGLFGAVSLEVAASEGEGHLPDAIGLIGYEQDWGAFWLRAGYDASYATDLDGFALSFGSHFNIGSDGSSFRLLGYYADGDHAFGTGGATYVAGGMGNAKWSLLASYYHQFTQTFGASVAVQYFNDFYRPNSDVDTGVDGLSAELALAWSPFPDFEVRSEFQYDDVAGMEGALSGYLRLTRSF